MNESKTLTDAERETQRAREYAQKHHITTAAAREQLAQQKRKAESGKPVPTTKAAPD